jgi:hypothetical protein
MTDTWTLRQNNDEPDKCDEEGCARPVYDGTRCKLHADITSYREGALGSGLPRHPRRSGEDS